MYNRLYGFLSRFNHLHTLQFGFRENHSTTHTLIKITDLIQKAIDKNEFACGIFIDLQKAFDTINHKILLKKLEYYGIRGPVKHWFKSYLHERKQYVKINNSTSNVSTTTNCDVPQGSVLGPLLFLIYINDLSKATQHSTVFHFADDTNLVQTNKSLKKLNKHANRDLKLLCEWLRANKISLNADKTQIIIFKSKQKLITKHLNFRISGKKINLSKSTKYLGIYLNDTLAWKPHILQLSLKLAHTNGLLSKIRHYVPRNTLLSIYHSLFSSHLTYGCQVWFQAQNNLTNQIATLQNKALRIINFEDRQAHAATLYKKLKILKINEHTKLLNCLFVYNCLHFQVPLSIQTLFTINDHKTLTRATRTDSLVIPNVNTTLYGLQSIQYRCITIWNEFQRLNNNQPLTSMTQNKLQNTIKEYYLNKYH